MTKWITNPLGWLLRYWFDVGFILVCVACLLSFFGQKGWSMDILACFRIPFMVAFSTYAGVYLLRGNWRQSLVCLLLLGIQLSQWMFYLPQLSMVQPAVNAPLDLKVMQFNVWKWNDAPQKVLAVVDEQKPDVLAVEEYTPELRAKLGKPLAQRFPYHFIRVTPPSSAHATDEKHPGEAIALYSRLPFIKTRLWWTQHDHKLPSPNTENALVATLQIKGQPVDVIAMHTMSPTQQHRYVHQKFHLAMLEQHQAEMASQVIIMGDLNATPWSWTLKRLIRQLSLKDSQEGFGVWPTWPRWLPLLPLDHVLYKGQLQVISRKVLPAAGSDHLPVVVSFSVSQPALPKP
jgi:endonuclease/exonuclease/phosphatase (EEP) superfamily protein YafD